MDRLKGKVAVITGGASGVGFGIATGFVREGAHVVIADLPLQRCQEACARLGPSAHPALLDVRDQKSIEAMVSTAAAINGGIDILVSSAGVFGMARIVEITPAEWDRIMEVNAKGLLFTLAAVARNMIAGKRRGSIINIASGAGRRAPMGAVAYASSKSSVIAITQAAAQELIPHGIRCNAIAPGTVDTPMWSEVKKIFPAVLGTAIGDVTELNVSTTLDGRMATPEDFVGLAVLLASDESSHILGQTINLDGGQLMN
jgi:NAD(P)-dependent dehydrogenase (short-subunit alcohol dehydrogenase family)